MSKMIIENNMRGAIRIANVGDGARITIETPLNRGCNRT